SLGLEHQVVLWRGGIDGAQRDERFLVGAEAWATPHEVRLVAVLGEGVRIDRELRGLVGPRRAHHTVGAREAVQDGRRGERYRRVVDGHGDVLDIRSTAAV